MIAGRDKYSAVKQARSTSVARGLATNLCSGKHVGMRNSDILKQGKDLSKKYSFVENVVIYNEFEAEKIKKVVFDAYLRVGGLVRRGRQCFHRLCQIDKHDVCCVRSPQSKNR
jgi:hypothetical protein